MLEVRNLSKVYDNKVRALDNVSFKVESGQFLAVIGLSGSGKSTLLRCINRLIEPTAGQIIWDGVDITVASQDELRRIRRRIAAVDIEHRIVRAALQGRLHLPAKLGVVPAFALEESCSRVCLETDGLTEKLPPAPSPVRDHGVSPQARRSAAEVCRASPRGRRSSIGALRTRIAMARIRQGTQSR